MNKNFISSIFFLMIVLFLFSCSAKLSKKEAEDQKVLYDDQFLLERKDEYLHHDLTWDDVDRLVDLGDFHFPLSVKIGIEIDVKEVVLTAPTRVLLLPANATSESKPFEVIKGARLVFTPGAEGRVVIRAGTEIGVFLNGIRVVTTNEFTPEYKNQTYRGTFEIVNYNSLLTLVNEIDVDEYLKGVVPSEIGRLTFKEFEALKAQAVAARTYTYSTIGKHKDKPYDLKATVDDQVYRGIETSNEATDAAVDSTKGVIMVYRGRPINAFFHSTCGGQTAGVEHVWSSSNPIGYLKIIRDTINGKDACSISPRHRWTKRFSWQQAESMLATFYKRRDFKLENVVIESRNASGRVERLLLYHNGDEVAELRRDNIRWAFRDNSILSSSAFDLEVVKGSHIVFSGGGFGHGVGMCQYGAINRSRLGQSMEKILKTYYQNISFYNVRQKQ